MSIEVLKSGSIGITGKESIALYRLMTLRRGILMEAKGIRLTRGRTCLSIVKSEFGWKGNRDEILVLLESEIALRKSVGIATDPPESDEGGWENEHTNVGSDHNGAGPSPDYCPSCR
jgi:hypothetical protein